MPDRYAERLISFIDLGTNSVRLLIVRINPNHSYSVIRRQKEMIRLGEGSFATGVLSEEAINRAVMISRKFVEISLSFGAGEIISVATSAAREAVNGHELTRRLKAEANLDVKIISGEEEARLIYLGISNSITLGDDLCFFIDIGGGSTEIIVGNRFEHLYLKSLKIGALRTYYKFPGNPDTGTISDEELEEIRKFIRSKIAHSKTGVSKFSFSKAYGSSGTIRSLINIAKSSRKCREANEEEDYIDIGELKGIVESLCRMSVEERKSVPGLNPDRADISATGAIILHTILKEMNIGRLYYTDKSLRDGLLFDYLSNQPGFPHATVMPVKERSVRQFGRVCRIDEAHAEHIIRLSKDLFLSAGECGLHDYGDRELEMLGYAAYLHDIGQFISFSKHQNHSYYVITNAPILGFGQDEQEIIGLITKYHRKKAPRAKDEVFDELEQGTVNCVIVLSLFLRIAEHLDRSHDGRVKRAYFSKKGKSLVLNIESEKDCTIELWAVNDDLEIIEKTFRKKVRINSN